MMLLVTSWVRPRLLLLVLRGDSVLGWDRWERGSRLSMPGCASLVSMGDLL